MYTNRKKKMLTAGLFGATLTIVIPALLIAVNYSVSEDTHPTAISKGDVLGSAYLAWEKHRTTEDTNSIIKINLGWSEPISSRRTKATGLVTLDFKERTVNVEVNTAGDETLSDVWLVDNTEHENNSIAPEAGDKLLYIGQLTPSGESDNKVKLSVTLDADVLNGISIDRVAITPRGISPDKDVLLYGGMTLFQRIYAQRITGNTYVSSSTGIDLSAFGIKTAQAENPLGSLDPIIANGADLFFNETFNGNGRTCGTCHRAENNFTIDPIFIATLPDNDPLFVAETNPDLKDVFFENPTLMRRFGLILENADGADDLPNKFVMRSVPHTLAMINSITADDPGNAPKQHTGWSSDGAPGDGTLRDFASGAVFQHYPLTVNRVAGVDFRLPNEGELDAMEAFQLATGRQEDLDLSTLSLTDPVADRGQELFLTEGRCNNCHANAGANSPFSGTNKNFNTGVEDMADTPQALVDPDGVRPDGGFGKGDNGDGSFGDGTFNTPPLVEAADTAPYFHNNSVATLEDAIAFYSSDAFNNSPSGAFGPISLDTTQVEAIGAFLRVINALENIRSAIDTAETAKNASSSSSTAALLSLLNEDAYDAIQVLEARGLHADAVGHLFDAAMHSADASSYITKRCFFTCNRNASKGAAAIDDAVDALTAARGIMMN
jgi:cytochrome c peroxidase